METTKCPSTDWQIKKIWHTYIVEYYSAKIKNEILIFTATWLDLRD
jgi:hypothetical protein